MVRINATNIKKEMAIYLACVQEWSICGHSTLR